MESLARLVLLQVVRRWTWRNHFGFKRLVGVAEADLAGTVIAGLPDVVIALLVAALTALGSHAVPRFRPSVCLTTLGISFLWLCRLGRGLRQGIVAAVQTPALRGYGIAPGVVGAGFTSGLVLFHIVSPWSKSRYSRRGHCCRPSE